MIGTPLALYPPATGLLRPDRVSDPYNRSYALRSGFRPWGLKRVPVHLRTREAKGIALTQQRPSMRVLSAIVTSTNSYDAATPVRTRTAACESDVRAQFRQSVIAALVNDLNPFIDAQRRLIAR